LFEAKPRNERKERGVRCEELRIIIAELGMRSTDWGNQEWKQKVILYLGEVRWISGPEDLEVGGSGLVAAMWPPALFGSP
jgi:hypothetical protein